MAILPPGLFIIHFSIIVISFDDVYHNSDTIHMQIHTAKTGGRCCSGTNGFINF